MTQKNGEEEAFKGSFLMRDEILHFSRADQLLAQLETFQIHFSSHLSKQILFVNLSHLARDGG